MNESDPLPDLHQSELDEATLRQLFEDVAAHTEVMDIIPKHAAESRIPEQSSITLADKLDLQLYREIRPLQIRYRHTGTIWWDTLMPTPRGAWRIIRIAHE